MQRGWRAMKTTSGTDKGPPRTRVHRSAREHLQQDRNAHAVPLIPAAHRQQVASWKR